MGRRWFAALKKGIGWYPVTWQGYLIVILYVVLVIWDFMRLYNDSHSILNTLLPFLPEFLFATLVLAFICYFTGEKPNT
ncbi:MAG: hypothetical protein ACM3IJ_05215 [Candidatus Levyibacteriota bacterium]